MGKVIRPHDGWKLAAQAPVGKVCAAAAALATLLAWKAEAATYNFYFNNAEQGDNSTAAPSVVVKDGKSEASAAAQKPMTTAAVQAPVPEPPTFSDRVRGRHVRFEVGGGLISTFPGMFEGMSDAITDAFTLSFGGQPASTPTSSLLTPGPEFSVSVLPSRLVALTGFYGVAYGGEVELIPLHLFEDRFEWGFSTGLSSLNIGTHGLITAHFGMRLAVNLTPSWAITLVGRTAPFASWGLNYALTTLGVTYSL